MADHPLQDLRIRSGVVWQKDVGFLLACDPKTEEENPHAKLFGWQRGTFSQTWAKFNAHSICRIDAPEAALVFLSAEGHYAIHSKTSIVGNIFNDSRPQPKELRYGSIRTVAAIAGKAYAVGLRGMVYRLDALPPWTRIDENLSPAFDVQAIDGFADSDLYAAGFRGELWHQEGQTWTHLELPTNVNLTTVKCAPDEIVYIGGHDGILVRGQESSWSIIEHEAITADVWDLEWFEGNLYVATMSNVYRLRGDGLEPVDFGQDPPKTCYHLSAADGVLWSIGGKDVMSFDGKKWTRIV
jgi:hypothetical protein